MKLWKLSGETIVSFIKKDFLRDCVLGDVVVPTEYDFEDAI